MFLSAQVRTLSDPCMFLSFINLTKVTKSTCYCICSAATNMQWKNLKALTSEAITSLWCNSDDPRIDLQYKNYSADCLPKSELQYIHFLRTGVQCTPASPANTPSVLVCTTTSFILHLWSPLTNAMEWLSAFPALCSWLTHSSDASVSLSLESAEVLDRATLALM